MHVLSVAPAGAARGHPSAPERSRTEKRSGERLPKGEHCVSWPSHPRGRAVELTPPPSSSPTRRFFRRWLGWSFLVARRPDGVLHDQVSWPSPSLGQAVELTPPPSSSPTRRLFQVVAGLGASRHSSSRRGAPRPGFMALAFARAGRVANTPVFLLTDEKVLQTVAGLVVSRRSSSRRGAPRPGFMALASARAGRVANTPAFLLTDEKVLQTVAGLVVSRRSSSRRGAAENAPCSTPAD